MTTTKEKDVHRNFLLVRQEKKTVLDRREGRFNDPKKKGRTVSSLAESGGMPTRERGPRLGRGKGGGCQGGRKKSVNVQFWVPATKVREWDGWRENLPQKNEDK